MDYYLDYNRAPELKADNFLNTVFISSLMYVTFKEY